MKRFTFAALTSPARWRSQGRTVGSSSNGHDSVREGATVGIIAATAIWIWLAVVDAIVGDPFQTFTTLGGISVFTAVHYVLNIVYGVVIVAAVHGTSREPSLVLALVFGLVAFEIALAMLTVLLSHLGLGQLAWIRIFGGSLVGLTITLVAVSRRHPLATQLRYADHRREAGA